MNNKPISRCSLWKRISWDSERYVVTHPACNVFQFLQDVSWKCFECKISMLNSNSFQDNFEMRIQDRKYKCRPNNKSMLTHIFPHNQNFHISLWSSPYPKQGIGYLLFIYQKPSFKMKHIKRKDHMKSNLIFQEGNVSVQLPLPSWRTKDFFLSELKWLFRNCKHICEHLTFFN